MINPLKVDEGVYRGAQPIDKEDWQKLVDLGIKYCLDLETGSYLFADGDPLLETQTAESYGITSVAHPLDLIVTPSANQLNLGLQYIRTHKPIYIHCKYGKDRTGMTCAFYRIHEQGWDHKSAVAEMLNLGMHRWFFYWAWAMWFS